MALLFVATMNVSFINDGLSAMLRGHVDRVTEWHELVLGVESHATSLIFSIIFHTFCSVGIWYIGFYAVSFLFLLIRCKIGGTTSARCCL